MRTVGKLTITLLLCVVVLSGVAAGPATAPATRPDPASERLTFLTLQLSSTEESIKAIDTALKVAGYKARVAEDRAAAADKGNELMDRKGGAPVPWDKFYGRTARDFIAPLPPGKYKVTHEGPGPFTYPTNDPVRRPAQFDYLYRANADQAAKAKQQVDAMGRKVDTLLARRRQLEDEQAGLWATIALEMIGNRDIAARPLYRFQVKPAAAAAAPKTEDVARAEIVRAAALFIRTADRADANAADSVGTDPGAALKALREVVVPAETALRDAVAAQQDAAAPAGPSAQQLKELLAVAKRAQLLCKTITDAHRLALDGDAAGDEPRKQMFRGQLQEALLGLADATGELDDAVTALAATWDVRPETGIDAKYTLPERAAPATPGSGRSSTPPAAVATTAITIHTATKVNVLTLERGAPRLYDSNPLRRIEGFDASLNGWQFVSIPQRVVISYVVHVNKPCTLYAFGKQGDYNQIFGKERAKWEPAGGAIEGKMVSFAFRRSVTAGEDLSFGGFEVQIAAESIALDDAAGGAKPPPAADGRRSMFDLPASPGAGEPSRLFDGRTLAGWDGNPKCWSVVDGVIHGVATGKDDDTYLFSRAAYRNFVFDADVKFIAGNTGILFRARPKPDFGYSAGYEADLFVPNAVGKLAFNEQTLARPDADLQQQAYKPRDWNRYTIEADGDHLRLSINGRTMTDIAHPGGPAAGHLGLQLHGPTEVYFRNVTIRELP